MSNGTIGAASYARTVNRVKPSLIVGNKYPGNTKKVKKMGWFRRKILKWAQADQNILYDEPVSKGRDMEYDLGNTVSFNLYNASGGLVINVVSYDSAKDRRNTSLHVITHDQDLGEALGKIITIEALKR